MIVAAAAAIPVTALLSEAQTAAYTEPEVSLSPSPVEGDPPEVREDYLTQQVELGLYDHSQALLDGDLNGWLEVFDSGLHEEMEERFDTFANMEVSRFDYQVLDGPIESGDTVGFRLGVVYCFGGVECEGSAVVFDSEWEEGDDELRIVEVDDANDLGPRPWEVDYLVAGVGERVVVAGPRQFSDDIDRIVEMADEAAYNADEFAVYEPVDSYVVFLADDAEFESWYGFGSQSLAEAVGVAIPMPNLDSDGGDVPGSSEVVLHMGRHRGDAEVESTLRHELAHVSTLHYSPNEDIQPERWWLAEGIAELIDYGVDNDLDGYPRAGNVEDYLSLDEWNGGFDAPTAQDDNLSGSAKYGIAFYGAYYMYTTHGEDEFMEFFGMVARDGEDAETAAQEVYGMSYSDIEDEMADFVEDTVG